MSGKSKKQPYRGSRAFDSSCRCHGGCEWCLSNRTHADRKRALSADEQIDELDLPAPVSEDSTP